ncbi:cysteine hydrolase [Aquibacillus koreensis]|uniref:Cysteine hydrolase n=1 Tax=Aquibacillus koreensis TaxID=279446 RepID=A0A9X3WPU5_9BACI|nr:isochorismatase family cysteine hydrolase [Aquibacillus koreensis]MCT2537900.1 cysteine hydrolase [Aquibacillus koreensis]MDC3422668.1 cysteine hydrolase [Aquibacillus koreensis]
MGEVYFEKENSALLIVNLQNAFVHPEGSLSKIGLDTTRTSRVIDSIRQLKEAFQVQKRPIIYIQHTQSHQPNGVDFLSKTFPQLVMKDFCAENSWDAEIIKELKPDEDDYVVTKSRSSAFYQTELENLLQELDIDTLVVTGIGTNICVESTVRDAIHRDYQVFIPKESTVTYLESKEKSAFDNFEYGLANVVSVKQMLHDILVLVCL